MGIWWTMCSENNVAMQIILMILKNCSRIIVKYDDAFLTHVTDSKCIRDAQPDESFI